MPATGQGEDNTERQEGKQGYDHDLKGKIPVTKTAPPPEIAMPKKKRKTSKGHSPD